MSVKDEFIKIYREYIKRDGADKLLEYLQSTDFFTAPASSRFHNDFEGGLCDHSINVYYRLKKLIDNEDRLYNKYSDETIAIIGLLHDLCKINFYVKDYKKVNEGGVWITKPYYKISEVYPFGHGEKSVYIINKFIKLTDIEALAINWHMGPYDQRVKGQNPQSLEQALHIDDIVLLTYIADTMSTYLDEKDGDYEN
ncbi:HD domain-containing protein [bacterium]|nr:HD domain-containing protein [bacterium]